jgi:Zn-finger nucleic acid-binding protein
MRCPYEQAVLELRSVEGHSGYRCVACRGAWLPWKYIQSIEHSRIFSVENFESSLLPRSPSLGLMCPHACGPLCDVHHDDIQLGSCPVCSGVWFPQGALAALLEKYKRRDEGIGTVVAADVGISALFAMLGLLS